MTTKPTEFEGLAFRVISIAARIEDSVDEILARGICHDGNDLIFIRQEVFTGVRMLFRDRRDALQALLKNRYKPLWESHKALFDNHGPISRVQSLRNRLAHRIWSESEALEYHQPKGHETGAVTVDRVAHSGTFEQGAYQRHQLTVAELKEGLQLGDQAIF